jgi:hypothetical protein
LCGVIAAARGVMYILHYKSSSARLPLVAALGVSFAQQNQTAFHQLDVTLPSG